MLLATRPFRLTPQREAVLDVVRAARDHPTARIICLRVKQQAPGIGSATVYRALNLLVEHRLIRELQFCDEPVARYDWNTEPHEHIRCTGCGVIEDVDACLPEATRQLAAERSGFTVDGYDLQFLGRCAACGPALALAPPAAAGQAHTVR